MKASLKFIAIAFSIGMFVAIPMETSASIIKIDTQISIETIKESQPIKAYQKPPADVVRGRFIGGATHIE